MSTRHQTRTLYCLAVAVMAIALSPCHATPVTDWVSLFDPQGNDPRFSGGSETTASPITTHADQDVIAANFPSITLADGEFVTLTGTVTIDVSLANAQFRIGLFDGPAVTQDVGNPYLGIYSEAPTTTSSNLKWGPGTHTAHLFGTGATLVSGFLSGGGSVAPSTPIDFALTIIRDGANLDVSSSYTDNGSFATANTAEDVDILATAAGYNYTVNTAAFLFGGSMNGNQAIFSNIDVTTGVIPEPSALVLGVLGLGILRSVVSRRRA